MSNEFKSIDTYIVFLSQIFKLCTASVYTTHIYVLFYVFTKDLFSANIITICLMAYVLNKTVVMSKLKC